MARRGVDERPQVDRWPERIVAGVGGVWLALFIQSVFDREQPVPGEIYGLLTLTVSAYFTYRGLEQRRRNGNGGS